MLNWHVYLFTYCKIYVLKYIIFMLFVHLRIILTVRNVEYQFNKKYSNNTVIIL